MIEQRLSWLADDVTDISGYYKSRVPLNAGLSVDVETWCKQKMDFIELFAPLMRNGLENIERSFKWCDSVWNFTKKSLENCIAKDEEIAKNFKTTYVADFTNEGKTKQKERDIHVGDKNNMVENYMLETLEILDQHKENHHKIMTDNIQKVRNNILKPLNTHYLDFKGTHYPKFKKISTEMKNTGSKLFSAINDQKSALNKLRTLMKANADLNAKGLPVKKDTIKCLIRLSVFTSACYELLEMQKKYLVDAWKCYSAAMINMNAIIHKNLIEFYDCMSKYAFPTMPGAEINIFDQIIFQEDDVCSHLDSIFGPGDIEQIKKYSQKEGTEGLIDAVSSMKFNFLSTFEKYMGSFWFDKKNTKSNDYLFVNVTPDFYLNTFDTILIDDIRVPTGKAIISDKVEKVKTKAVEWKKEFILTGNQPGAWFSSGKSAFLMNDENEVKELKSILEIGKKKVTDFNVLLKASKK